MNVQCGTDYVMGMGQTVLETTVSCGRACYNKLNDPLWIA